MGDPIEVAALTQAFGASTREKGFCAIGSVKSNVGHVDRAAGVTGLIKTVLSLEHGKIPASLHYEHPESEDRFWEQSILCQCAAERMGSRWGAQTCGGEFISGVGGTNAHVVVEEAPEVGRRPAHRACISCGCCRGRERECAGEGDGESGKRCLEGDEGSRAWRMRHTRCR